MTVLEPGVVRDHMLGAPSYQTQQQTHRAPRAQRLPQTLSKHAGGASTSQPKEASQTLCRTRGAPHPDTSS